MVKLKPLRVEEVTLVYKCYHCELEHWLTEKEAKIDGFKFICHGCDQVNEIDQIVGSRHVYSLASMREEPNVEIVKQAVRAVYDCGYHHNEAVSLVDQAVKDGFFRSREELVKRALANAQ